MYVGPFRLRIIIPITVFNIHHMIWLISVNVFGLHSSTLDLRSQENGSSSSQVTNENSHILRISSSIVDISFMFRLFHASLARFDLFFQHHLLMNL